MGFNIADDDHAAAIHQSATELVQGVFTPIRYLGVDRLQAGFLPRSLGQTQRRFQIPEEAPSLQLRAIRTGGSILEPEVDTNGILTGWNLSLNLDHNIEVPAASGIFREAAGPETVLRQAVAIPHLEVVAVVVELTVLPLHSTGFERYPAERAAHASAPAPLQPGLFELLAAGDVLAGHFLQGLRMQAQVFTRTLGVGINVVGR